MSLTLFLFHWLVHLFSGICELWWLLPLPQYSIGSSEWGLEEATGLKWRCTSKPGLLTMPASPQWGRKGSQGPPSLPACYPRWWLAGIDKVHPFHTWVLTAEEGAWLRMFITQGNEEEKSNYEPWTLRTFMTQSSRKWRLENTVAVYGENNLGT